MEIYTEAHSAIKPFSDSVYAPNAALGKVLGLDVESVTYLIAINV